MNPEVRKTKTQAVDHTVVIYRLTVMDGIRLGLGLILAKTVVGMVEDLVYRISSFL